MKSKSLAVTGILLLALFFIVGFTIHTMPKHLEALIAIPDAAVSKAVIVDGSNGNSYELTNSQEIEELLASLSKATYKKLPNPHKVGTTYSMTLYDKNSITLLNAFFAGKCSNINGIFYWSNKDICDDIASIVRKYNKQAK
ncbi:MAG: hypothetical protein N2376_04635 [Clostridia bacterium]|nr:hypothetical protein [Clostridia bacterium]